MRYGELKYLWKSDLYRYDGRVGASNFLRRFLSHPGFKYSFWLRLNSYLDSKSLYYLPCRILVRLQVRRYQYRYGIEILPGTKIGPGLQIGHFGGIVVSPMAILGRNVGISHGVTIGETSRGNRRGAPEIGDRVYIGPGAKIIGAVRIGDNVAVGANCVVTRDVPSNSVVVGIPGRVMSQDGAEGYVLNTDY